MKIFFRKIRIIFDIEKWLWKSEFCNLAGLITSTKIVQKFFEATFVISGVLASIWKVFIKFHWHGQNTTKVRAKISNEILHSHVSSVEVASAKSLKVPFNEFFPFLPNFFTLSWWWFDVSPLADLHLFCLIKGFPKHLSTI